jgi:hypothetical protein
MFGATHTLSTSAAASASASAVLQFLQTKIFIFEK